MIGWIAAAALFAVGSPASAATLVLGLDFEFSGATAPGGTAPWVTATFDDSFGGPNTVRLTMSANNLIGTENIAGWYFNFDPALDPTALTFTPVDNSDSVPNSISTGVDAFKADGDGLYDFLFDFPPPPGFASARFTAGEVVIYDITYTSAISASSFEYFSTPDGGNGTYLSAAHILGTGGGSESGWIGTVVPEPSTALLVGFGLAALGHRRRAR